MTRRRRAGTPAWLLVVAALVTGGPAAAQSAAPAPGLADSFALLRGQAQAAMARIKAQAAVIPPLLAANTAKVQADFAFTPGHLCSPTDPNFKEYRYAEHIPYCQRHVTLQMKTEIAAHYGVPRDTWSNYEFDHLIPLAIGGDSSDDNLWPQPRDPQNSMDKDKLEFLLYREMAAGTVTQADAVHQIYGWFTAAAMAEAAAEPPPSYPFR